MKKPTLLHLFAYHYFRFDQIWDNILTLPEETFHQNVAYSHGSLCKQFIHIIDDDAKWIAFLGENTHQPLNFQPDLTRQEVYDAYQKTKADNLQFINEIEEDIFNKNFIWRPPFLDAPQRLTGMQVLLHVVNHGTDHRGQLLRILHDFGAPTFDQDLMGYLIQTGITAMPTDT